MNVTVNTFYQYFGLQEVKSIWKVEKNLRHACTDKYCAKFYIHSKNIY